MHSFASTTNTLFLAQKENNQSKVSSKEENNRIGRRRRKFKGMEVETTQEKDKISSVSAMGRMYMKQINVWPLGTPSKEYITKKIRHK